MHVNTKQEQGAKNVSPQTPSNEALCALCCGRLCTCALRVFKPRAAIAHELSGPAAGACTLGCVADVCVPAGSAF